MDILSESIFVMPACRGLNNFGTMHLMATNFIMWIRILFKESVHTVVVAFDDMKNNQTDNSSCNPIQVAANASKLAHVLSNKYGHENHGHQNLPLLEDFLDSFACSSPARTSSSLVSRCPCVFCQFR